MSSIFVENALLVLFFGCFGGEENRWFMVSWLICWVDLEGVERKEKMVCYFNPQSRLYPHSRKQVSFGLIGNELFIIGNNNIYA